MKMVILKEVEKNVVRFYEVIPILDEVKDKPLEVQLKTKLKFIGTYRGLPLDELVKKIWKAKL